MKIREAYKILAFSLVVLSGCSLIANASVPGNFSKSAKTDQICYIETATPISGQSTKPVNSILKWHTPPIDLNLPGYSAILKSSRIIRPETLISWAIYYLLPSNLNLPPPSVLN